MPRPRPTTLAAWLATMTLVAACGGAGETTAPDGDGDGGAGGNTVSMSGQAFSPASLTIAAGTTVTFTDTATHTVTEGTDGTPVDDPIVDESGGADIEVTFDEPGTYTITCKVHPQMNMTITVEG
jgi:plastocyanin